MNADSFAGPAALRLWPRRWRCSPPVSSRTGAPRALALQGIAPAPGLAAGLLGLNAAPVSFDLPGLGFTLRLDPPGALLLAVAALLWIVVTAAVWRNRAPDQRFGVCWLLTMIGSLGVFIAGDLVSFYLRLCAWSAFRPMACSPFRTTPKTGAPAPIYMAFAILGEALLLLAFALLAAGEPHGSARIADVMAALPASPWRDAVLALIVAGFGMKMGLIPFNGWMPLNYAAAPIPAAAVLSGAGVKAGVIGLIRFLPLGVPLQGWGEALAAIGFRDRLLRRAPRPDPAEPQSYPGLFQHQPDGRHRRRARHGARRRTRRRRPATSPFTRANHLLVKAALFLTIGALAARGATPWRLDACSRRRARVEPRRAAVDRRRAGQAGVKGAIRRRMGGDARHRFPPSAPLC